jgi:hypothetical protein
MYKVNKNIKVKKCMFDYALSRTQSSFERIRSLELADLVAKSDVTGGQERTASVLSPEQHQK